MSPNESKAEEILDSAEGLARNRGFNGFSFRDLANEVGIKSASVHYHFPTKADLGRAITRRYADRFLTHLGDPEDPASTPEALLQRYVAAIRHALVMEERMCLCGMLGAEIATLPEIVAQEVRDFFARNIDWLIAVLWRLRGPDFEREILRQEAQCIIAALQGAMMLARSLDRVEVFDEVASHAVRD